MPVTDADDGIGLQLFMIYHPVTGGGGQDRLGDLHLNPG